MLRTTGRFREGFVRARFETGSSEMIRGLGSGIDAISIRFIRDTFVLWDVVGDMAVGRVRVAVNMYAIVPRSN